MKVIVVTGTPGTGKTTVAKRISRQKGYAYVDVKKLITNLKLNERFDKKRKSWVVDVKRLNKVLISTIEVLKKNKIKGVVFDSHLAHYLPRKYVNLCIVTRTDTKRLYTRLKKRGYSKSKTEENIEAEIMQVILDEAREMKHRIKIVNT